MNPYEAPRAAPAPKRRRRWLLVAALVAIALFASACRLFLWMYYRLTSGPAPTAEHAAR
jgi:hypothetical protein